MLIGIVTGLCMLGCTHGPERLHPQFSTYHQSMGRLLVLVPEIVIFEQLPDGSRLYQDIRSRDAQRTAQHFIVQQLQERGYQVNTTDTNTMQSLEIRSITSLFRSVNRSIQLHTFGPQPYPAKLKFFEYNLGPVDRILKASGADGLVLALGHQTSSVRPIKNWLSVAIVEPEGRVIWYGMHGDHHQFDLLASQDMDALVATTIANFWEHGS